MTKKEVCQLKRGDLVRLSLGRYKGKIVEVAFVFHVWKSISSGMTMREKERKLIVDSLS